MWGSSQLQPATHPSQGSGGSAPDVSSLLPAYSPAALQSEESPGSVLHCSWAISLFSRDLARVLHYWQLVQQAFLTAFPPYPFSAEYDIQEPWGEEKK